VYISVFSFRAVKKLEKTRPERLKIYNSIFSKLLKRLYFHPNDTVGRDHIHAGLFSLMTVKGEANL
jgi:hypothetical protein